MSQGFLNEILQFHLETRKHKSRSSTWSTFCTILLLNIIIYFLIIEISYPTECFDLIWRLKLTQKKRRQEIKYNTMCLITMLTIYKLRLLLSFRQILMFLSIFSVCYYRFLIFCILPHEFSIHLVLLITEKTP